MIFRWWREEGGSAKKWFPMIKGEGEVQAPPEKHDIINEQPHIKSHILKKKTLEIATPAL